MAPSPEHRAHGRNHCKDGGAQHAAPLLARRRRPPSFYSHSNPGPNPLPQQGPAMTRGLRPLGTAITLALLGAVLHSSPAPAQARRQPKRPEPPEMRREQAPQRLLSDSALAQLKYRYIGPVGNRVSAVALGHGYGPQEERGVYRTTDGGKTWERVLFVDRNTGASDIAMDPNNPRILFAGMWQLELHTWGRESGGPGSGIYASRDGGTTWKKLTGHGLPAVRG